MLRLITILSVFAMLLYSCESSSNESSESDTVDKVENSTMDNESSDTAIDETNDIYVEVNKLFKELLSFKNDTEFHQLGFSENSPYREWLLAIQKLKTDPKANSLIAVGFVVGDLEQLGQEYRSSNGRETDYSKLMSETIEKGLIDKIKN